MTNLLFWLKLLAAMIPFFIFVLLNSKANLKAEIRYRQFFMPALAIIYCAVIGIFTHKINGFLLKITDKFSAFLVSHKLPKIGNWLHKAVSSWGVFVALVLFNFAAIFVYIIFKKFILAIPKYSKSSYSPDEIKNGLTLKIIKFFYEYDEEAGKWYLKPEFGQAKIMLTVVYYLSVLAVAIILFISCHLCIKELIAVPFYPVFPLIILGEFVFFLNGSVKERDYGSVSADKDSSKFFSNYALLRTPLKKLFGDRLSSEGTVVDESGESGSVDDVLKEIESEYDYEGTGYARFIKRLAEHGLEPNPNYLRAGVDLATGHSLLFNTPFYYKLSPYVFYAMQKNLLKGGNVLIVLGRHGVKDDLEKWCQDGLFSISGIPNLWKSGELTDKSLSDSKLNIGIISRSNVHNLDAHRVNSVFLQKVSFVVIIEPSKLVTTAQVGLSLLIQSLGGRSDIVYCSFDHNCDGLLDALAHILMTNIAEVSATEHSRGVSSYMCWNASGDYLQHKLLPGISRYLGIGTELSFVALENQVKNTVWYGGDAFPVSDIHWIAKQYYYDLLQYAGLPQTQESFDHYFQTSFNMYNQRDCDDIYLTVEDEQNNLFELKRNFSTISRRDGFINVISGEYMLRQYMASNETMFITDPKAIPYVSADYARTKRNCILKICLRMCIDGIRESDLVQELTVQGLDAINPVETLWKEISLYFAGQEYPVNDDGQIKINEPEGSEPVCFDISMIHAQRKYIVSSGRFESVFVVDNEAFRDIVMRDLYSARYIAERGDENQYLGTELKGHIFQKYMPGQFFTINGKYYEMLSVSFDNRVLIRRASDHIDGRYSYRQVRKYKIGNISDSEVMGDLKTVNGIKIFNQFADISVETPAYWKMTAYNDFAHGTLVEVNAVPERRYYHKQLLKIDFSGAGDGFNEKVRQTLALLINEAFRTLFAENQPFISAVSMGEITTPSTYSLEGDPEEVSSDAIYIIEDSQVDLGLLVAVERNVMRLFNIIADYLTWNEEEIAKSLEEAQFNEELDAAIYAEAEQYDEDTQPAPAQQEEKPKGFLGKIKTFFWKLNKGKNKKNNDQHAAPVSGNTFPTGSEIEPDSSNADTKTGAEQIKDRSVEKKGLFAKIKEFLTKGKGKFRSEKKSKKNDSDRTVPETGRIPYSEPLTDDVQNSDDGQIPDAEFVPVDGKTEDDLND